MADYTIKVPLPNGETGTIKVPENATREQILAFVQQQYEAGAFNRKSQDILETSKIMSQRLTDALAQPVTGEQASQMISSVADKYSRTPTREDVIGLADAGLAMGTAIPSTIVGGVSGLVSAAGGGLLGLSDDPMKLGADLSQGIQEALTYQPDTRRGQELLGDVASIAEPLSQFGQYLGDKVFEATGSPALATAARIGPEAATMGVGLNARAGTTNIAGGTATPLLRKELARYGTVYENLPAEIQRSIPATSPRNILGGSATKGIGKEVAAKQIQAGGMESGLAPFRLDAGKITKDTLARDVIKQGFEPGVVQMVKQSNPATRTKMAEMLKNMERLKSDQSLQIRPADVVGESIGARLGFVRDKVRSYGKQLNEIANKELKGKSVEIQPVMSQFQSALDDLQVKLVYKNGEPTLDFSNSIIVANPAAKSALNSVVQIMKQGEPQMASVGAAPQMSALRMHQVKRQLDDLIDYNKTSFSGLSGEGQRALQGLRSTVNNTVRDVSPSYAKVNDTIAESLSVLDNLNNATASKIDIFNPSVSSAQQLGLESRKLFSNYQNQPLLLESLNALQKLSDKLATTRSKDLVPYTGKTGEALKSQAFDDNMYNMARFALALDDRFGAAAEGSLKAMMQKNQGMTADQLASLGDSKGLTRKAMEKADELAAKFRETGDLKAYSLMEELLKREQK